MLHGNAEPANPARTAEIAFACTGCGYCDVACKFIMDAERHQINTALRECLVDKGLAPVAHKQVMANLKNHGRPYSQPEKPLSWAEGLPLKILPQEQAEVVLFAGCGASVDSHTAAVARKLAKLLIRAGITVGTLGDAEPCCGFPAYTRGFRDIFTDMANDNIALFNEMCEWGVKTLVPISGCCLGTLRSKYPEYVRSYQLEVLHATEILARLASDKMLTFTKPVNLKATYHDPCYLGRQSEAPVKWNGVQKVSMHQLRTYDPPKPVNRGSNGVFDAPRRLLNAIPGLELKEMYRIREYAYCCGGGGGAPETYPEMAQAAAINRLQEARSVGAEAVVTACHNCESQFRKASGAAGMLDIRDIIDIAYQAAGMEE